ncbi:hypothetical protein ACFXG4_27200 [Nocardia sp. NPDC059246]|uniref:phage terminase small subunit n=1 Tax=unclassified Nocardia TaxID=2637762 RepID=UPI0036BA9723
MPGPLPKPPSQRRRRNAPKSYGEAIPTEATAAVEAPTLGFRAHKLVREFYAVLRDSVEAQYYSPADWHRVRMELFFLNSLLEADRIGAQAWAAVQAGLTELLVSPAAKRRLGIEMRRAEVDEDEDAAVADLAEFRARLGS